MGYGTVVVRVIEGCDVDLAALTCIADCHYPTFSENGRNLGKITQQICKNEKKSPKTILYCKENARSLPSREQKVEKT